MRKVYPGFNVEVKNLIGYFLSDSDWLVQRHKEQVETGSTTSLTTEEYTELLSYRQYLRGLSSKDDYDETFAFREFALKGRYCILTYSNLEDLFPIIPE